MFLFPRICPVCTIEFEGGNHVQCPRCEDQGVENMHTALMELKRDVMQLNADHVAYVKIANNSGKKTAEVSL